MKKFIYSLFVLACLSWPVRSWHSVVARMFRLLIICLKR